MAYRIRERDGPAAGGRFPFLRRAPLAADAPAHRGRKFWVSFAQLRRMASATSAGQLSPPGPVTCIGTSANHRQCAATGTDARFPLTAVMAPRKRDR